MGITPNVRECHLRLDHALVHLDIGVSGAAQVTEQESQALARLRQALASQPVGERGECLKIPHELIQSVDPSSHDGWGSAYRARLKVNVDLLSFRVECS